jgi:serine/threonine protein kinase
MERYSPPVEAVYPIEEIREALAHSQRNPGLPMAQPRMSEEACPAWLKRSESEDGLPPSTPTPSSLDADWAARPIALTHYNDRMALVLEDPGGTPLDRLLGRPLDVSHFLRIAIPLAGALRHVHERGLIHKDIKPANILVESASSGVWLTGFGIASRLPRERQAPAPPEVIAGTLPYMAPEQTGRMNPLGGLPQRSLRPGCHPLRDVGGDTALHGSRSD